MMTITQNTAAVASDDESTLSVALQEALGVTKNGTCLRHVNCPVLLKNNTVMSCRVCFTEEKSVGIQQRKCFAAVVNQLHRMAEAKEDENRKKGEGDGGGDNSEAAATTSTAAEKKEEEEKSSLPPQVTSDSSSIFKQPMIPQQQTLESIMKRLSQVQNWMLRQKEKEVLSLQLNIHRLEQRIKDQESTVTDQKETIRALRRTIQQDLKIIKTMATQKERELEAEHARKQEISSRTNNDAEAEDDEDDSENAAEVMYESPVRAMKAKAQAAPIIVDDRFGSPSKRSTFGGNNNLASSTSSAPSSPLSNNSASGGESPAPDKFAKRRGKKNLFVEGSPSSQDKQPMQRPPARKLSSQSLDASATIPEDNVLTGDDFDSDSHDDDDDGIKEPFEVYIRPSSSASNPAENPNSNKPRSSEYWSDEDLTFANDPSKLFASFRGGLLDIPKSPPPACHNREKQKLKLKVKLDCQGGMSLKLPSIRHVGRTQSGMSDGTSESLELSGMECGGVSGIPLNLLASQLQTLPALDHSTHTLRTTDNGSLNTPVSAAGDDDASTSSSPMSNTGSSRNDKLPQPPPPPLSLLGVSDDEGGDEEDLLDQKKFSLAPRVTPTTASPDGVPERVALSSIIGHPGGKPSGNSSIQEPSVVTATYSLETLESLPIEGKQTPNCINDASNGSLSTGAGTKTSLPTLMERLNESTADLNADDPNTTFSVTRASCQDRYGDPGIYTGSILVTEGLPHGNGTMNYESGRVYEGEWLSGHWNGKGHLLNPNGDTYEGEFVFDARHGKGTYKWDNGDIYVGSFSQDKRHGHGKFNFHNGNVYEGEFVDGMFEGFGRYDFAGGSYEGDWKQGRYEGNGELKYANGGMYTGEFRNSVAHGFGLEITADGQKRRGVWEDGQPAEL